MLDAAACLLPNCRVYADSDSGPDIPAGGAAPQRLPSGEWYAPDDYSDGYWTGSVTAATTRRFRNALPFCRKTTHTTGGFAGVAASHRTEG